MREESEAALNPLLEDLKDESRFDTTRARVDSLEVEDPVHRV
jgi:hypothetical protein